MFLKTVAVVLLASVIVVDYDDLLLVADAAPLPRLSGATGAVPFFFNVLLAATGDVDGDDEAEPALACSELSLRAAAKLLLLLLLVKCSGRLGGIRSLTASRPFASANE